MRVNSLSLRNFRNYSTLKLDFNQNINVFIGANAQGKTNILEALYLGAMGRSHRTHNDDDFIKWQQQAARIDLSFFRYGVENKMTFQLIKDQKKEILLNDSPVKMRDLVGTLNSVLFSPEDLLLVKGTPALRRRFLDNELSQANPLYYRQLLDYNKIINQRNHLLKTIRERRSPSDFLDEWDEQLAKQAAVITGKRLAAIKKLAMLANLMHRKLTASKENLTVLYDLHGSEGQMPDAWYPWYKKMIYLTRSEDIAKGSTSIGPHRDDLILLVNDRNLRIFGSQGQQRTGALALKLAELEFIKSETGEYPLLLLDDVMSELDTQRREQLLAFIKDKIQTFITATEIKYFPEHKFGRFYRIENGAVMESW